MDHDQKHNYCTQLSLCSRSSQLTRVPYKR